MCQSSDYWPPCALGGGYLVNQEVLIDLHYASFFVRYHFIDDTWMGMLAFKMGIAPTHSNLFNCQQHDPHLSSHHIIAAHGLGKPGPLMETWKNQEIFRFAWALKPLCNSFLAIIAEKKWSWANLAHLNQNLQELSLYIYLLFIVIIHQKFAIPFIETNLSFTPSSQMVPKTQSSKWHLDLDQGENFHIFGQITSVWDNFQISAVYHYFLIVFIIRILYILEIFNQNIPDKKMFKRLKFAIEY